MAESFVSVRGFVLLWLSQAEADALHDLAKFAYRSFEGDPDAARAYIGSVAAQAAGRRAIDALRAVMSTGGPGRE